MTDDRADREEPTQPQERTVFQGQSASGYARQHNGNVYNSEYIQTISTRFGAYSLRLRVQIHYSEAAVG